MKFSELEWYLSILSRKKPKAYLTHEASEPLLPVE
ncbi:MAG: hypothetical protein ACJAT1_000727 [Marivirga sp.]|jgi:hypothetical protein